MKRKKKLFDKKSLKIVPLQSTAMMKWYSQTLWRRSPATTSQRRSKEEPELTVDNSHPVTMRRVSAPQLRLRLKRCTSWTEKTHRVEVRATSSLLSCSAWCAALLTARLSQPSLKPRGLLAPRISLWETSNPMMRLNSISEIWTWLALTCQMNSFQIRILSLEDLVSRKLLT